MNITKRLAKNIMAARKQSGLSLRQLAPHTKVGHATLNNYEHGRKVPTVPTLILLCRALNVPVSKMLEGCE
jgi:transcriptional regulator with XRE-family HTH domain